MRIKFTLSILLLAGFNILQSQIVVTEVYADTPFNERLRFGNVSSGFVDAVKHHRGEFVEIYNYSDKDINLKNWYMKDRQGSFNLPDKILKKGEFMVIAYSSMPMSTTIFSEHFPSTSGKEDKIIYQDEILLRNKIDEVYVGYTLGGVALDKSGFQWKWENDPAKNFIPNLHSNPAGFMTIKSIQYHPDPGSTMDPNVTYSQDDSYNYTATPNPLEAVYVPPTQSYDELVKNDFQQYYYFLDWSDNVNFLVNNICSINIEKVYQNPAGSYTGNGGNCFSYDSAGNMILSSNCNGSSTSPPVNSEISADELEVIKNSIVIHPNPTKATDNYNVTISWSGAALGKIQSVQVFNSSGSLVYSYIPGANTTSFNLQNQLPGSFIANFVLNTGQIVSKNILKW